MRLKWLILFVVTMNVHCQSNTSAHTVDTLPSAVRAATYPLTLTAAGDLQDAGGKLMTDAIKDARFVLIGESHFSRETPRLAAAVCLIMRPDSYAVEAGPYAAAYVNGLLQDSQRASHMRDRERTYPASMAFLNDEQENDLAAGCAASSQTKKFTLWGLDQEFEGASAILLQQMNAEPNGRVSAAAIRSAMEKDKRAEARARLTGDATQLFLTSASDDDVTELQTALKKDGTAVSESIMREFVASRRIYRLNLSDSPGSNSDRASLLKKHFLERYRALQRNTSNPRILLKFGDNHMWKGFNDTHQLDLGNFVAELASVEHSTSLHIQVLAARGTLAEFDGYAKPMKDVPFVLADTPEYGWLKPVVEMLPDKQTDHGSIVVDLRKLRFRDISMTGEWERLVYGYDLLVMLREFTPANLYH
ncbi:MAG: hypothetical protein QOE55_1933 [Acidobacteriaceae bacterium]|jgi:hypothetical protein|nr:hypothetical protein [Acidobacteriaceae bacterium]